MWKVRIAWICPVKVQIWAKCPFSTSGLDPAGPFYESYDITTGINPAVADFVDIVHTMCFKWGLLFWESPCTQQSNWLSASCVYQCSCKTSKFKTVEFSISALLLTGEFRNSWVTWTSTPMEAIGCNLDASRMLRRNSNRVSFDPAGQTGGKICKSTRFFFISFAKLFKSGLVSTVQPDVVLWRILTNLQGNNQSASLLLQETILPNQTWMDLIVSFIFGLFD